MKLKRKTTGAWTAREWRETRGHAPGTQGPTVWVLIYGTLWLQICVLAAMTFLPRGGRFSLWMAAGWMLGSGVVLMYVANGWAAFHDFLIGFEPRGRVLLEVFIIAASLLAPKLLGFPLLPDFFLWWGTLVLPFSVTPGMLRRALAISLLGGWFAARDWQGPIGLGMTLGFGATWLLALGSAHIGFLGEPFLLRGWWLPRLALRSMLGVALPAGLAAGIVFMQWQPFEMMRLGLNATPEAQMRERVPLANGKQLDPREMMDAMLHLFIAMAVTIGAMVILHFLMRKFRKKGGLNADLLPGQVGRLHESPPGPDQPRGLEGRRGEIVRLWARWARAQPVVEGRDPADTAREFAQRVAAAQTAGKPDAGDASEKLTATEILEHAHYDVEEPSEEELSVMRQLTLAAIEREKEERKQAERDLK